MQNSQVSEALISDCIHRVSRRYTVASALLARAAGRIALCVIANDEMAGWRACSLSPKRYKN